MDVEKDVLLCKLYFLMHKAEPEDDVDKIDPELEEEAEPMRIKTALQRKILGSVRRFEKAMEEELNKETQIQEFLKGYQRLALLSKSYSNEETIDLFNLAQEINISKGFGIDNNANSRLDHVIFIDAVAHNLHQIKNSSGSSLYKQLDELADISKSQGESWREDRLLILENPINASKLEELAKIEIFQKGSLLDKSKSFWRLFEKAMRGGVKRLTDVELVALREWLYSRV